MGNPVGASAQVGAQWTDKFGRVRTPSAEFYDDDGNLVAVGQESIERFDVHNDAVQAKRREALRKMSPTVRRTYATYLRTGRLPEVRARAPREARNDHQRGSRRGERSTSSSSDDPGPEPEPAKRRLCACNCGLDISHRAAQARYASDSHAAYARQRRKRDRDRARDLRPGVTRRDPYLRLDADELERLRRRIETGCRCNGHHIADPEDGHCTKCGHRRGWALPVGFTVPARSAETRRARSSEVPA
jgi:hypothetical protein